MPSPFCNRAPDDVNVNIQPYQLEGANLLPSTNVSIPSPSADATDLQPPRADQTTVKNLCVTSSTAQIQYTLYTAHAGLLGDESQSRCLAEGRLSRNSVVSTLTFRFRLLPFITPSRKFAEFIMVFIAFVSH